MKIDRILFNLNLGNRRLRHQHVTTNAGLQQVDENKPERQRHKGRTNKPGHCPQADPPERFGIAHMGNPGNQCRKHDWRDDHLDHLQEHIRHGRDIMRDLLELLG